MKIDKELEKRAESYAACEYSGWEPYGDTDSERAMKKAYIKGAATEGERLRKEICKLRTALAFYASYEHYVEVTRDIGGGESEGLDWGEVAREALKKD